MKWIAWVMVVYSLWTDRFDMATFFMTFVILLSIQEHDKTIN